MPFRDATPGWAITVKNRSTAADTLNAISGPTLDTVDETVDLILTHLTALAAVFPAARYLVTVQHPAVGFIVVPAPTPGDAIAALTPFAATRKVPA